MTNNKFIQKTYHLKGLKVRDFEFRNYGKELVLHVVPFENGCQCPKCNRRCKILNKTTQLREWRDLYVSGTTIYLTYMPREINCPTHGRIQEDIPWADQYSRITYRLEFLILTLAKMMAQKAAAKTLNMPKSTFSDLLHRSIENRREGHKIRNLKSIGIDEISYCKGRKYATIVYDIDKGRVLWVSKGKGRETIDKFFDKELSEYQINNIEYASCDMAPTYVGAIKDYCPNATLVIDKFHIVKALNDAVDELRKEEWRQLEGEEKKSMKGLRWLLFKHSKNRTKGQTHILNQLKKSNRRIHRAWTLKDEFEAFWDYTYVGSAKSFLKGWITAVKRSRLEPLKSFVVNTLEKHWDNIITYIGSHVTNAVAEGVNRVIRYVKNRASGYSNFDSFKDLILLVIGDLDIPAQIPARFRTL